MVNKVILVGRVRKNGVDVKEVAGTTLATFMLSTSETFTDKSGEKKTVYENHMVEVWGNLAEKLVAKYVKADHLLLLEGKIKTDSWEKDGKKHYKTIIRAENIRMLADPRPARENNNGHSAAEEPMFDTSEELDSVGGKFAE